MQEIFVVRRQRERLASREHSVMFQVFASRMNGDESCGDGYELQLINFHGSGTLKLSESESCLTVRFQKSK